MQSQRPNLSGIIPDILTKQVFNGTSLLQIDGKFSTGKCIHLLELVTRCILDVEFGGRGRGGEVVYIDINCQLDMMRLSKSLEAKINREPAATEKFLQRYLARLKVKRVWTIG